VLFFSAATSATVSSNRSCKRRGGHRLGGLGQLLGDLELTIGGDDTDTGAPLTLGFSLTGHGALYRLRVRRSSEPRTAST
jgi:hypothetical protein